MMVFIYLKDLIILLPKNNGSFPEMPSEVKVVLRRFDLAQYLTTNY
jgi:hypothetical protein